MFSDFLKVFVTRDLTLETLITFLTIENNQALRYKIWDLGLASKSHYKGKIWAFGTKLGLFWDHFWTFPGLLSRYFHENAKNVRKGQNNALSRHFPFQNISNGQ